MSISLSLSRVFKIAKRNSSIYIVESSQKSGKRTVEQYTAKDDHVSQDLSVDRFNVKESDRS